jgi:hypothetical protein
LPLSFRTDTGKIKLESKDDMRRRGVKSPNYGDALALAFLKAGPVAGVFTLLRWDEHGNILDEHGNGLTWKPWN